MLTDFSMLNEQQKEAILQSVDHNVVLLAGAGSGKTTTMVKRTEYLIRDLLVKPERIMLVTFTNKAAGEINARLGALSCKVDGMISGTFHSVCAGLLGRFGHTIGISSFSIMDPAASYQVIRNLMKEEGLGTSDVNVKACQRMISRYKNNLVTDDDIGRTDATSTDIRIYRKYYAYGRENRTFDFDDLILYTIAMIRRSKEVENWLEQNLEYVMVDECQDSNPSQFALIRMLGHEHNIMLIGDVNQSIYGFRNASPKQLEEFAKTTLNTKVLKLERNYRSTKTIIDAANRMITHNTFGTMVEMSCENIQGSKIRLYRADNIFQEAEWVVSEILTRVQYLKKAYSEFAIIYRNHYQSRLFEEQLNRYQMPYVVLGGGSFFARKEVKDLLAFCKAVTNPYDTESFKRVLLMVKGIGEKTADSILQYAIDHKSSFADAIKVYMDEHPSYVSTKSMKGFWKVFRSKYTGCADIVDTIFIETDYRSSLAILNTSEAKESVRIMDEFLNMMKTMTIRLGGEKTQTEILQQISLLSEEDHDHREQENAVKLLTAHASKGLEFSNVFIVGMQEGTFPSQNAIDMEEERRLFYVAMTRAKENLFLTYPGIKRDEMGTNIETLPSRFLSEIPEELREYTI